MSSAATSPCARPAPTFKGLCPFHDDHRPSFDVDPRRQRYRCWSCGKFGDVISFVQEFEQCQFSAKRWNCSPAGPESLWKTKADRRRAAAAPVCLT